MAEPIERSLGKPFLMTEFFVRRSTRFPQECVALDEGVEMSVQSEALVPSKKFAPEGEVAYAIVAAGDGGALPEPRRKRESFNALHGPDLFTCRGTVAEKSYTGYESAVDRAGRLQNLATRADAHEHMHGLSLRCTALEVCDPGVVRKSGMSTHPRASQSSNSVPVEIHDVNGRDAYGT